MEEAMSGIQGVSAAATAAAAIKEEANESPAMTRIEAASGDPQAIRKLAASQPPQSAKPAEKPFTPAGGFDFKA
jgi:hypothetical protein